MLTSLMAILLMAVTTAVRDVLAAGSVVLEGPTTLELGLIGAGLFAVYAVASRRFSRRRERFTTTEGMTTAGHPRPEAVAEEQEPSRGAA